MTRGKPLSKEIIAKIKKDMLNEKSKYQIAKELNLSRTAVYIGQGASQVDLAVG